MIVFAWEIYGALPYIDESPSYGRRTTCSMRVYAITLQCSRKQTKHRLTERSSLDRAVAGAGLVDFVRDHGMGWVCGERGSNLSGGVSVGESVSHVPS